MLFRAKIDETVLTDENALCEQLYIFLKCYVPKRLVYENQSEREDCTQETVMYMLSRYRDLTDEERSSINIEKFFYNRAKQYISIYLRGVKRRREIVQKYKEHENLLQILRDGESKLYIEMIRLNKIIEDYSFTDPRVNLVTKLSINILVRLGYRDSLKKVSQTELKEQDPNGILTTLSYAITDEYLLRAVEDRGDDYK